MKRKLYVYACGIEYESEMDAIPVEVHPNIATLKRLKPCWEECGIVKLEVVEVSWPVPQNLFKNLRKKKNARSASK